MASDDMWLDGVEEDVELAASIRRAIWADTRRLANIEGNEPPHSPNTLSPTSPAARRLHLLHLKVATAYAEAGQEIAREAAERAGRAGAGFPELGEAAGITRQAARKRWPNAAGTIWRTHWLPRAGTVTTASARSREQAISRARYVVQQGLGTTDGSVAAVVTDSTGAVVWACVADHERYDAVELDLPENLAVMPKDQNSPERRSWTDAWRAFVDREVRRGGTG